MNVYLPGRADSSPTLGVTSSSYTAHAPLPYVVLVPPLLVVALFVGADQLAKPPFLRVAVLIASVVLAVGIAAALSLNTSGPAVASVAPLVFIGWQRAVAFLFGRIKGSAPFMTGAGTQSWTWHDLVYTWVLLVGAGGLGALSLLALDGWGPFAPVSSIGAV